MQETGYHCKKYIDAAFHGYTVLAMKPTKRNISANIQLPSELAEPLREIAKQMCMDPTNLARLVLRGSLRRLKSGEASIVNGDIQLKAA